MENPLEIKVPYIDRTSSRCSSSKLLVYGHQDVNRLPSLALRYPFLSIRMLFPFLNELKVNREAAPGFSPNPS